MHGQNHIKFKQIALYVFNGDITMKPVVTLSRLQLYVLVVVATVQSS